jgi:hypothetical protein
MSGRSMELATGAVIAAAAFSPEVGTALAADRVPVNPGANELTQVYPNAGHNLGSMTLSASPDGKGGFNLAHAADATTPPANTTVTMVSRGLNVSEFAVASKNIVIGQNDNIKIDKATANNCIETKPGQPWTNSVRLANGSLYKYEETTPAKLCRDKFSSTGWVKRGGGETGKDCRNIASPNVTPAVHKNVEVINVTNLNTSFILKAAVHIPLSEISCPGVNASGGVDAEIDQKFSLRSFLKLKGAAQVQEDFKLIDNAKVKAGLNMNCNSTETTTPPTTTTPGNIPPPPVITSTPVGPKISLEQQNQEGFNIGDGPIAQFTDVVVADTPANPNGDPANVVASVVGTSTNGGSVTQPVEVSSSPDPNGTSEDIRYEFFYSAPNTVDVKVTESVKVTDEAAGNGLSDTASTYFPISQPF